MADLIEEPSEASARVRTDSKLTVHPVLAAAAALGAAVVGMFWKSLNYALLKYDSERYIVEDRAIRMVDWEHVRAIFKTYHFINYNPLHRLSYMIDHALWGFDPAGYRGTNILLHWAAALCLFGVLHAVTRSRLVSYGACLVFALHPTRVESVVWLAQRKDVLGAAFGFGTLWAWRTFRETRGKSSGGFYALTLFCYWGAVASKAQWVPLVGLMVLLDLFERRTFERRDIGLYAPFVGLSGLFAWYAVDAQLLVGKKGAALDVGWSERIARPFADFGFYVRKAVWPTNLSPRYVESPASSAWEIAFGVACAVTAVAGAARSWFGRREVLFGLGWFVALLSPMLNLTPGNLVVADRYLYVSIVGLAIPAWLWIERRGRRPGWVVLAVVTILMTGATWRYMPVWESDYSLWSHAARLQPDDVFTLTSLGKEQLERKEFDAARTTFEHAAAQPMWFAPLTTARARHAKLTGADPMEVLSLGLALAPNSPDLYAAYGQYLLDEKRWAEAERYLLESNRRKRTTEVMECLARLFLETGQTGNGLAAVTVLLDDQPFNETAWVTAGKLFEKKNALKEAESAYREAARLAPELIEPRVGLARLALGRNALDEAESWMRDARRAAGGRQLAVDDLLLLAEIHRRRGATALARGAEREARAALEYSRRTAGGE